MIDTLIHYGVEAGQFTVNLAVNKVALSYPAGNKVLSIGGVFNKFTWKDNLTLISIGAFLPLGFDFYPSERIAEGDFWPDYISLQWRKDSDGTLFAFQPNRYNLPAANYELSVGAFLEPNAAIGEDFNLVAELPTAGNFQTLISMIGVPATLDGETFSVPIFAKVEHTIDLI